jgi:hypothetical protein
MNRQEMSDSVDMEAMLADLSNERRINIFSTPDDNDGPFLTANQALTVTNTIVNRELNLLDEESAIKLSEWNSMSFTYPLLLLTFTNLF